MRKPHFPETPAGAVPDDPGGDPVDIPFAPAPTCTRHACTERSRSDGWNGRASQSGGLTAQDMSAQPVGQCDEGRRKTVRHDGWTGDKIATFLDVLADTGIVSEACRVAGMSRDAAYALRNRDPVAAAAWRAALVKARAQVADGILERSLTGTVEHYYRDGVLVGERRHYESWLALAVLKRLDKLADDDRAEGSLAARIGQDWPAVIAALRDGGTAGVPALLAPKADKADSPPPRPAMTPPTTAGRPTQASG